LAAAHGQSAAKLTPQPLTDLIGASEKSGYTRLRGRQDRRHLWIVGADASVLFLPGLSGSQPAFTAHGQVGIKF
jgi:hypothetical protein